MRYIFIMHFRKLYVISEYSECVQVINYNEYSEQPVNTVNNQWIQWICKWLIIVNVQVNTVNNQWIQWTTSEYSEYASD